MTTSLLVELHTEELPPKALKTLSEAFAQGIADGLRARKFLAADSEVITFGAPRRLAVRITHVAGRSADEPFRQKLLPVAIGLDKLGNATAALLKKLATLGRGEIDPGALTRESDGKQDVLFYEGTRPGETLVGALQAALDEALAKLPIPKVMSYQLADGATTVQFVRPAHRLVALHGHGVVPVRALGLEAGTKTFGHRFMAPGELAIHSAATYAEQMEREGKMIPSFAERRARIEALLAAAAAELNATPIAPDELLDEVTALTEWPVVYASGFEEEFLAVPAECLILTMQQNQKYFALRDRDGRLINRFLLVSHLETDDPSAIIDGNARVVRARLADAKFFYDQDRKEPLEARIPGLANVVYHNKLGSQLERVERIVGIAVQIAKEIGANPTHVERAARLAKADLRTLMVGEFPELQGIMGRYYALHDGEAPDVADAIEQHYRPRFAGDAPPATPVATCVALADKLETLVGLFGIGERPTGEKDPYALRRHALGVLRMLLEQRLPLELSKCIDFAAGGHESTGPQLAAARILSEQQTVKEAAKAEYAKKVGLSRGIVLGSPTLMVGRTIGLEVRTALAEFFFERLRGLLREQGCTANEVESVLALAPQRIDLVPQQLAAVRTFMQLPEAASLAAANKRIGNILKKSAAGGTESVDPALLFEPAERALFEAYEQLAPVAEQHYAAGEYEAGLTALAPLKAPVDAFFDDVMVNVEDEALRNNRLALLARLRATMNRVADLSLLAAG
ncbi:MAG: glycine--tRNA ligase subunit beta [Burkholderiales bacterium]|jgi:glycyl-tRNA synthetase beta chain|nr:glycine--tRNA ligase subunit beta [Burkholderiales bacterium]